MPDYRILPPRTASGSRVTERRRAAQPNHPPRAGSPSREAQRTLPSVWTLVSSRHLVYMSRIAASYLVCFALIIAVYRPVIFHGHIGQPWCTTHMIALNRPCCETICATTPCVLRMGGTAKPKRCLHILWPDGRGLYSSMVTLCLNLRLARSAGRKQK